MRGTPARRYVVDLSDLFGFLSGSSRIAGIQRLLLAIAARSDLSPCHPVVLAYWDPIVRLYLEFEPPRREDDVESLRRRMRFPHVPGVSPDKYADRPWARRVYTTRRRLERAAKLVAPPVHRHRRRVRGRGRVVELRDGDVLLSLGAGWNREVGSALDHAMPGIRAGRVTPVVLVHDLIPLLPNVERVRPSKVRVFEAWLERATRLTDRFLVYSEATARDLAGYLDGHGRASARLERFALAHALPSGDGRDPKVPSDVRRIVEAPYALAVGSVRGRKNGSRLVEAWRRLAERPEATRLPRLVFATRDDLGDLDAPLPRSLTDRVRFVRADDDATLAHLYRHARFCVFPSLYEGWGLPIGEALAHGQLCLTSNTSSMPEVAGPNADYFDPYDVESISTAIARVICDDGYLERRRAELRCAPIRTWDDAARDLFTATERLVA